MAVHSNLLATRTCFAVASALLWPMALEAPGQVLGAKWTGQDGGRFGKALANAGDVDSDGADDLIVGEWRYDTSSLTNAGRAVIYSGATLTLIRTHDGATGSESFGYSVTGAGDVDQDGYDDYAVGGPGYNTSAYTDAGRIVVYSGDTGNVIWTAYGDVYDAELGTAIAGVGDQDGDGRPELIAGMPNVARMYMYDGFGNQIQGFTLDDELGACVARLGDVDGDGIDNYLVTEPGEQTGRGAAHVLDEDLYLNFFFLGTASGDRLGHSAAGIGDVNGDGVRDIVAGAPDSSAVFTYGGYVRVASGVDGATLRTHDGDAVDDQMGYAVTNVGDLDLDGVEDYAGAALRGGASDRGLVRIYSGQDGSVIWEFEGALAKSEENTYLGSALAGGDFNSDGFPDLALGDSHAWEYVWGGNWYQTGGVWIYYGCPAWSANYGAGWKGRNGIPNLVALDDPGVGETIDVQLDNSLGADTVAILFGGFYDANFVTSAGGTLLVTPLFASSFSLPAGGITLSNTLPDDPALYFLDVYLQALEADPYASNKLSFTPGLRLRCGFDL